MEGTKQSNRITGLRNRNLHARTHTSKCVSALAASGLTSFFSSFFRGVLASPSAADMGKVQRRPRAALSIVVVVVVVVVVRRRSITRARPLF
jgi:hypothetical protein